MGRPKKDKGLELLEKLLDDDDPEIIPKSRFSLEYIDEDAWIAKGSPDGYTTAKIEKYRIGTPERLNAYNEYLRLSYSFAELANELGYPLIADEYEWKCAKEKILEWRKSNNVSSGDMCRILQICWDYEYSKKKIASKCRTNHVEVKDKEVEKEVKLTNADISSLLGIKVKKEVVIQGGCEKHPNAKGLRIPRNGCKTCMSFYLKNKEDGVKESRNYG